MTFPFLILAVTAFTFGSAGPSPETLNSAIGANLLVDDHLWDDEAETVAARLRWPLESRTDTQSSYRLYPPPTAQILGARPYSLALYAIGDSPDRISMVFAKKRGL
ncbi:MAG: hypothetical protein OHK005_17100 [Candidatus Methylacidiphilales bacterium]